MNLKRPFLPAWTLRHLAAEKLKLALNVVKLGGPRSPGGRQKLEQIKTQIMLLLVKARRLERKAGVKLDGDL